MIKNVDKILKKYNQDVKRHMGVLTESFKDEVKIVSEQVAANTEQITAIREDVDKVRDDIGVIKLDIEIIKNDLKQKVSREEFVILEKRVGLLEARRK
ncbi:MAG: hypothetical protein HYT20_00920 [Candidatus Nealsonbacteria bacterium]|nr:hypothetical protein [Candidatus Nealsonbacteria bacterium]